jgi:hypothetical protein
VAFTLRLDDARTEVIHLAAIDGKTGSNSRHAPARINAILNRKYRELLSRAGQLGLPHGLTNGGPQTLGSPLTDEDFISVDIPSAASEVVGIDVRTASGRWSKLDSIVWEQRRDIAFNDYDPRARPGGLLPAHGVGFWAVRQAPSVSGSTLTAGKLAVWPTRLGGGQYQLQYVANWTAISADTDLFLLYEGWDEWLLNAAAMACAQRDSNKRTNYDTARDAWLIADGLLEAQAARLQRTGSIDPTPYGGINL